MTECNRCGDCCEQIGFSEEQMTKVKDIVRWVETTKDIIDEEYDRSIIDSLFISEHWTNIEDNDVWYQCDMFDKETRLCLAHDNRPPVCRDFPWYNRPPEAGKIEIYKNCSFWEDIKK